MNHASKEQWQPDVVVVVFRDEDGRLDHFKWSLSQKGVSRQVSTAIYKIIVGGFRKSFVGFFYTMTHKIDLSPF